MSCKKILTVFTPTFNRAHTLPRTYQSLKDQDCFCFDWLIVDDGSTDNTKELVENWQKENNPFCIKYIYKQNGGMHTAYNTAYDNIDTDLNICIDSDDQLAKRAARIIFEKWEEIKDDNYAGMIGLDADLQGKTVGLRFPEDMKETTVTGYYASGGRGDKKLVYRTDIIKMYPPYPVFPGENYVGLSCKFAIIDQDYKLAVVNEVLCNVEYQQDGHSTTMFNSYLKNPKGFAYFRRIMMKYSKSRKKKAIESVHYVSSSLISKDKDFIKKSPEKLLTLLALPFGVLETIYIIIMVRLKGGRL